MFLENNIKILLCINESKYINNDNIFCRICFKKGPFEIIKHSLCHHKNSFICSNCFTMWFEKNQKCDLCRCDLYPCQLENIEFWIRRKGKKEKCKNIYNFFYKLYNPIFCCCVNLDEKIYNNFVTKMKVIIKAFQYSINIGCIGKFKSQIFYMYKSPYFIKHL